MFIKLVNQRNGGYKLSEWNQVAFVVTVIGVHARTPAKGCVAVFGPFQVFAFFPRDTDQCGGLSVLKVMAQAVQIPCRQMHGQQRQCCFRRDHQAIGDLQQFTLVPTQGLCNAGAGLKLFALRDIALQDGDLQGGHCRLCVCQVLVCRQLHPHQAGKP